MGKKLKNKIPPIGLRIVKSAIAILICFLISFLRGKNGIVFYSQLAALWCIQMYVTNSRKNAVQRFVGTTIGAVYGLLFLLIRREITLFTGNNDMIAALIISGMIIIVLYTTVFIKKKQASYFSCVVFLSIVVNHMGDSNPYLFVWNRFLDTIIGIVVGIGVNSFALPKEKQQDILFISGLDDTLLHKKDNLSDYSKVELNRMLDEGINFTIATMRTPASLMKPMSEIRLKLPVIAMDGAVLYDIQENIYLKVYVISNALAREVLNIIENQNLTCFINIIIDDTLVIYYQETEDEVQKKLIHEMRRSPYRNYVQRNSEISENVVYFMLLLPAAQIESFYEALEKEGMTSRLKVLKYASTEYPGYAYIKIYNKNATREHMSKYLQDMLKIDKTVTFGSIPDKYDVTIEPGDTNRVVHELKKRYEPVRKLFRKK